MIEFSIGFLLGVGFTIIMVIVGDLLKEGIDEEKKTSDKKKNTAKD